MFFDWTTHLSTYPSWELTISPKDVILLKMFLFLVPFPKVGYVSFLEAIKIGIVNGILQTKEPLHKKFFRPTEVREVCQAPKDWAKTLDVIPGFEVLGGSSHLVSG